MWPVVVPWFIHAPRSGLEDQDRTVPESAVGGLAGGSKYIVRCILFKFAIDGGMFGGARTRSGAVSAHVLVALQERIWQ